MKSLTPTEAYVLKNCIENLGNRDGCDNVIEAIYALQERGLVTLEVIHGGGHVTYRTNETALGRLAYRLHLHAPL